MEEQKETNSTSELARVFRQGAVAASIWKRTAASGHEYYDFSLSRSWRSKDGSKQGYSPNFYASNEAELTTVIQDACQWIAQHQSQLQANEAERGSSEQDSETVAA